LRFGAATSGTTTAELDSLATLVNEGPSLVTFYQDWNQPVPVTILNQIDARGATPVIAWEPWAWGGDANQPTYSLQNIISGNFDAYINQWAVGLKNYGKKVMLRFAHEMNGDWYPWSERVNGNSAGQYVSAWRHVRDIFTANGVTNVQWVWNPNVNSYGMTDYASIFPGADYVDIVGLDGYNWGTTQTWGSTWQNPSDLFDGSITLLRSIAPGKAILIAETASAETGGDKAAWNSDLITYLNAQPDVMGFIWFNLNKEVDWRVESSTTSANALKTALASRL
jgi:beta-mannanase